MVDRPHKPSAISPSSHAPQPTVDIVDNGRVRATLPSGESIEILLHGATVISWKSNGVENLWLSEKAILDGSKPVRGGIPVVFPVFGPPPANHATSALPQHGFARSSRWEFLGSSKSESDTPKSAGDDTVKLDFGLYSNGLDEKSKSAWPYEFGLVYSVTLSKDSLRTMITIQNTGDKAFEFTTLLHSYFKIKDVHTARIAGLSASPYVDKVLKTDATQSEPFVSIPGTTDRVYYPPGGASTILAICDASGASSNPAGTPRFEISRDNMPDVVVWNPWKEGAEAMGDFAPKGDDPKGYRGMLCVEAGSVKEWVKLEGGESWEGGQVVKSLL
ncbi:putative glucose-6-phosphate 1-epimerase [Eremomyces bilateralis CBS 781.70]|uniref:Glucose-6-phosphate 1-epimerase n=1 Tax=Eremomyces bilateralis CBS 781.70 TaxID=1392243 RepID=A0A6G1G5U3_9PEZI|nr:putative glucose-6-phosphate 1-epimerase [Eremomyces bilateralis CBS 781.70]KAF1813433.1 putative glucose-6-phosphate 1-epimerase [Eremomyces bilateralis CBS 781.70]